MKKAFFVILVLINSHLLFAQDCIPNPTNYSKDIVSCLKYKSKDSLNTRLITWKDIEPIYDSILTDNKKTAKANDSMPSKDSAESEIEVKLVKDLKNNIDTLLQRGQRIGVNWQKIIFKQDASKIVKEKDMPDDLWFNDGKMVFSSGDSLYEMGYKAMLIQGIWKLVDVGISLNVYDKNGMELGKMSSYYEDYSKPEFDSAATIMDSAMTKPKPAKKKPATKKHAASTINQQSIRKPEQ